LAGDAWNVLATREIGVVTDVAAVLVDGVLARSINAASTPFHRWRQPGEEVCNNAQILVAYTRHSLVHDVIPVRSLALEMKLDFHVRRPLGPERGHFRIG